MSEVIIGSMKLMPIRAMVRSAYQLQKLRIQTGQRTVAHFKELLGQEAGEKEDVLSSEALKFLADLRKSYVRISDAMNGKVLRKGSTFVGDGLITDYAAYTLVETYETLLQREEYTFDQFDKMIHNHVMYDWLMSVRGVGSTMAAVLLSEIDIENTNTVAQLWAYAGLDVVKVTRDVILEELPKLGIFTFSDPRVLGKGTPVMIKNKLHKTWRVTVNDGRCRLPEHLVKREYTDKHGETMVKDSITFSPFLKTKVMGVLSGCLVMGDGYFREVFDNYRHRLENSPQHKGKVPNHIVQMANRYTVKIFLQYFWVEWRKRAGLPVTEPYDTRKLGIVHSGPMFTGDTPRKKEDIETKKKFRTAGKEARREELDNRWEGVKAITKHLADTAETT